MNKRGQFYLVAAIIIIVVIFGLYATRNYLRAPASDTTVYDLEKELNLETGKVADWAIYNQDDTSRMIENWTEIYVNQQQGKDVDNWIFVYGNKTSLTVLTFKNSTAGIITLEMGATSSNIIVPKEEKVVSNFPRVPGQNSVTVKFNNFKYSFDLGNDKNFAMIIKKGDTVV